jgi:hypothetical protein
VTKYGVNSALGFLHRVVVGDFTGPENGGSMYFRIVDNFLHNHKVRQPKNRIDINK